MKIPVVLCLSAYLFSGLYAGAMHAASFDSLVDDFFANA